MLLEVKDITVWYGTLKALDGVSFYVDRGEMVAIVGPNGAGKSTALRTVVGILKDYGGMLEKGDIIFKGKSIRNTPPYELVRLGISYVPQGRRVFPSLTVEENLDIGGYTLDNGRIVKERMRKVFEIFPILEERRKQRAGTLSGGEQQILAIARALMIKPELLILDEPLLGLSPNYIKEVMEKLKQIKEEGIGVLVVEHNIKTILKYADRIYVLKMGRIAFEGSVSKFMEENKNIDEIF